MSDGQKFSQMTIGKNQLPHNQIVPYCYECKEEKTERLGYTL